MSQHKSPPATIRSPWIVLSIAAIASVAVTVTVSADRVQNDVSVDDPVRDARCFAKCYRRISSEQPKCYSSCLKERWIKPGKCPVGDLDEDGSGDVTPLDRPCLELCSSDDFCHAENKCCRHSCGVTCQPPFNLTSSLGLPDIPNIVAVSDHGKILAVEWSSPAAHVVAAGHVTYLLQERHHVGVDYVSERMTRWATVTRTDRVSEQLRQLYAPGRWFQFRVAAINENGTRGYSSSSKQFFVQFESHPEPPGPPENLMVSSLKWTDKDHQQCVLSWTPPANNILPVRKYRVIINVLDGLHVYHKRHVVPADILRFPIKNLISNSEYFLQVQAISEFGRKRLAGQKASMTLKTKGKRIIKKITEIKISRVKKNNDFDNHFVNFRISWKPVSVLSKKFLYTVTWSSNDCYAENKPLTAKTPVAYLDLYSLNPSCKYLITVSTTYNGSKYVGSFIYDHKY